MPVRCGGYLRRFARARLARRSPTRTRQRAHSTRVQHSSPGPIHWGVLVIDMIQFFIKMSAVIAAAYFAVQLPQVGGMHGLVEKLSHMRGPGGLNYINMLPDFTNNW